MRYSCSYIQFPFGLEPVGQIVAMSTAAREENLVGAELDLCTDRCFARRAIVGWPLEPSPAASAGAALPISAFDVSFRFDGVLVVVVFFRGAIT